MARRNAKFGEAYKAIQTHLKDKMGLDERAVLLRIDSDLPPIPMGVGDDKTQLGVAPGSVVYPDFTGHPVEHCTVDAGVMVTSITRIWSDDANTDAAALFDANLGLMTKQVEIIKHMVSIGAELLLPDGNPFLHDSMRPIGSAKPAMGSIVGPDGEEDLPVYFQTIEFIATFDLDLS